MAADVISMDGRSVACSGSLGEVLANYGPRNHMFGGGEREIYQRIGSVVAGEWQPLPPKPAIEPYFYMLYEPGIALNRFTTREQAEAEAERIARQGKKVYVLEATAFAESRVPRVTWERRA